MPVRGTDGRIWLVVLFFGLMRTLAAEEPPKLLLDELRVAVDTLHVENQRLKDDLQQR